MEDKTYKLKSLDEALHPPNNDRMNPNRLVGQSVGASKVGDMVSGNPATTNLGSGTSSGIVAIANASSTSFLFTLSDNFKRVVMAVPDIGIYTDATGTASITSANQYPNATYGMGNMPVVVFNDWGLTNNVNVVCRVIVRNNTGTSRNVIVVCRWRLITNSSVALSGVTTGGSSQ